MLFIIINAELEEQQWDPGNKSAKVEVRSLATDIAGDFVQVTLPLCLDLSSGEWIRLK